MPLELQTAPIGQNFNGTASLGFVALTGPNSDNDTQRAEILSVSVQSADVQTSIWVRLAATIADANGAGDGYFIELGNVADSNGINLACCKCIVPRGWSLFVVTAGPVLATKHLAADWHRVTLEPRA